MIERQKTSKICSQKEMRAKKVKLKIKFDMVEEQYKKLPNLKVPGSDSVQGYWIKKLNSM